MEKKETTDEFEECFANDVELQIMQLLQTKKGRKVLKEAIDQLRKGRAPNDQN